MGTEIGLHQVSQHPDSGQDFLCPENLVELPATFCRLGQGCISYNVGIQFRGLNCSNPPNLGQEQGCWNQGAVGETDSGQWAVGTLAYRALFTL